MPISISQKVIYIASSRPARATILWIGMRRDKILRVYFSSGPVGQIAMWSFFWDEIGFRSRWGRIVQHGPAVALVGLYPRQFIEVGDLSRRTRFLLSVQGARYRGAWRALGELADHTGLVSGYYLSAIATLPGWRRRGLGSRILLDLDDDVVELETSSSHARDWYGRRGFVSVEEYVLRGQALVFLMRRPGRDSRGSCS